MTCHGYIRNGMIVLEEPVNLPDGVPVNVEVSPTKPSRANVETIAKLAVGIDFDFEAVDRLREISKL